MQGRRRRRLGVFKYLNRGGEGKGGGVSPPRRFLPASCRLVRSRTAFAGNLARGMEWDGRRDGAYIALNSSILIVIPSCFSEVGETAILLLMPAEIQVESDRPGGPSLLLSLSSKTQFHILKFIEGCACASHQGLCRRMIQMQQAVSLLAFSRGWIPIYQHLSKRCHRHLSEQVAFQQDCRSTRPQASSRELLSGQ